MWMPLLAWWGYRANLGTMSDPIRIRRQSVKRWLATYLLSDALLYPLWRWYRTRKPRSAPAYTSDHHIIDIQDGVRLEVFWKNRERGPGPSASFFVLGDEVLRLDCFGVEGLGGHYHINPRQVEFTSLEPVRLFFPLGSHEDHIERAAFEIENNLPAALAMNREPRICRSKVDSARLAEAAKEMRKVMLELLEKHREELVKDPEMPI